VGAALSARRRDVRLVGYSQSSKEIDEVGEMAASRTARVPFEIKKK
jgi:hypothetical protein